MFPKECEQCGGRFMAKRAAAKFCSARCRQRHHVSKDDPVLPPHRESAPVVKLPPLAGVGESLTAITREELNDAGRLHTSTGLLALKFAQLLDGEIQDTSSGIAALGKQYLATMALATAGVKSSETPLEKIRREREMKAG